MKCNRYSDASMIAMFMGTPISVALAEAAAVAVSAADCVRCAGRWIAEAEGEGEE